VRRLLTAVALVAGALATATAGPAVSASAATPPAAAIGLGVRLLDAPTAARNDPRAQVYIVDRLPPGAVIHRRIELTNSTPGPLAASVYPAAADIAGAASAAPPATPPTNCRAGPAWHRRTRPCRPGRNVR